MTVPVCWMPLGPGGPSSQGSQWDEALLDAALTGALWHPAGGPTYRHQDGLDGCESGAVVVVAARYWAADTAALNEALAGLAWCVVVLASDEESSFPWRELAHPAMRLWVMTPRPGLHPPAGTGGPVRYLGEGWPHRTPQTLAWYFGPEAAERPLDWFFAGQVTHDRRRACADQLRNTAGGRLVETASFAAGVAQKEYLAGLAAAKVAPCPSGPVTPDSFRLYEALEAGCVPVVDGRCPGYPDRGYWDLLLGGRPRPWRVVDDWAEWPDALAAALAGWPANAAACSAWWQGHKRDLVYGMAGDVAALSGSGPTRGAAADSVTVVVTASPTPDHPSTAMVADTLDSVRVHPELAGCDAIVVCDGIRPGMEHRADAYGAYLRELCWRCEHEWPQTLPLILPEWQHQSGAIAAALDLVRTPLVLMMEHDTPLCGEVPWQPMVDALLAGRADLVRFYHEASVHPEHAHLMLSPTPVDLGFPAIRTVQWSQRPQLVRVDYYRRILADHFADRVGFVEDTMHGVVQHAYADDGIAGWRRHKLVLYAPAGDTKRSLHSDGRRDDPKAPGWALR